MKVLKQPAQLVPFSEMTRHFAGVQTLPSLSTKSGKGPFPHFFFTEGRGRLYTSYTTLKLDNCLKPEQKKFRWLADKTYIGEFLTWSSSSFSSITGFCCIGCTVGMATWALWFGYWCHVEAATSATGSMILEKNIKQAEIYDNALMRKWYKITVYNKQSRIHNEIQQNYPGG